MPGEKYGQSPPSLDSMALCRYLRLMNLLDYTIQTGFLPQFKCESLEQVVARGIGGVQERPAPESVPG